MTRPSDTEAVTLTEQIAEAMRPIVADYALSQGSVHVNWRCGYPDTYGPCNCVDEFIADATETLAARLAGAGAQVTDCTCPPDEFLTPSDCALHGDDASNQFRHSNGEETGVPENLRAQVTEAARQAAGEAIDRVRRNRTQTSLELADAALSAALPHMGTGQDGDYVRVETAEKYRAMYDGLRARISALADEWEAAHDQSALGFDWSRGWHACLQGRLTELRALLDRPAAAETEGETP